ncbi:hypothetical protein SNARM312S_06836 [Streptomyces narbonensis]
MPEAWRTRTSPAWVRRISRPVRISSGVPAELSSAFICWLTAGWVQPSSRAAAEGTGGGDGAQDAEVAGLDHGDKHKQVLGEAANA